MTGDTLFNASEPAANAGTSDTTDNGLEIAAHRTDFINHLSPPGGSAEIKNQVAASQSDSQEQADFKPYAGQADPLGLGSNGDPSYSGQTDPLEMLYQQAETQAMVQEYRSKHPELIPFEPYILKDAALIYEKALAQGQALSDRQAVDTAIAQFKAKLGTANPAPSGQGQAMKRVAMRLDVSGSQPKTLPDAEAIWNMSSEEFAKFERQVNQNLYT